MKLNKKISIPLTILTLAVVVVSWLYKSGKLSKAPGLHKPDDQAKQEQSASPLWTCPMHPFIIKDRPGSCPICGMDLIKKISDAQQNVASSPEQQRQLEQLGQIALSPAQRVMANVAVQEAAVQALTKEITAVGVVQYDQSRQAKVTAWIAGRIDRLHVSTVGAAVNKERPVAELYSPELVASQQEYLLALKSRDQLKHSALPSIAQNGEGLVASARQRLMLYGVKEHQIRELERAGQPIIRLPIYTPLSGVATEKLVQEGQYVNVGDPLFNIADLSRVWVELEVYENELPNLRVGQTVEISTAAVPGRPLQGRVALVYPFLDPKTRTVRARVELSNPGLRLKPDMYVNALLKIELGSSVVLPVSAVIDSGKRQMVWVEREPGIFEPRQVQVGQRSVDKLQILSGVTAGEKVAVSGAYLIDSESQLRGNSQDHSQHTGTAGQPAPATGKKPDPLDMGDMQMK
jgi:Cu(I)/Ag(I) efflux system membrane fusion protein